MQSQIFFFVLCLFTSWKKKNIYWVYNWVQNALIKESNEKKISLVFNDFNFQKNHIKLFKKKIASEIHYHCLKIGKNIKIKNTFEKVIKEIAFFILLCNHNITLCN